MHRPFGCAPRRAIGDRTALVNAPHTHTDFDAACADEVIEPCDKCGTLFADDEPGRGNIECEQCLRGFHLDCLSPPLAEVPEVR